MTNATHSIKIASRFATIDELIASPAFAEIYEGFSTYSAICFLKRDSKRISELFLAEGRDLYGKPILGYIYTAPKGYKTLNFIELHACLHDSDRSEVEICGDEIRIGEPTTPAGIANYLPGRIYF